MSRFLWPDHWWRPSLIAGLGAVAIAWALADQGGPARASDAMMPVTEWQGGESWQRPSDDVLRAKLSPLQYRVTQEDGTESPFRNAFWDHQGDGLYVDIVSGEPLFSSVDKYKSGTGWPSFVRVAPGVELVENTDHHLGYPRTEIRSALANSHLGHVFPDGPPPTGQRYCINSAALAFVPVSELEANGYGAFVAHFAGKGIDVTQRKQAGAAGIETAYLAGGCYWGMEDLIRDLPGVIDTEVGFAGGHVKNVKYEDLRGKDTGHAETIRVEFDPAVLSYAELLDFFFRIHDPTTVDRQGNDRGSQYRSAIFFTSDEQRATAERVKAEWDRSKRWGAPIVTQITPAGEFWAAKESHQDYLEKIPNGYTCHFLRDFDG